MSDCYRYSDNGESDDNDIFQDMPYLFEAFYYLVSGGHDKFSFVDSAAACALLRLVVNSRAL
jgi:hypothetical protein